MRLVSSLIIVLSLTLLVGCASKTRSDSLTATLTAYASTLRWGSFESAQQFVDPAVRKAHPLSSMDESRYQQFRVSDYDNGAGPVPTGDFDIEQTAQIRLINVNTQGERSIIDHQTWHYDAAAKHWWLTSGLPNVTQQ
ncbi:MAG: hypothetical protein ABI114_09965 [Rhodanobacter sp.]